MAEIAREAGLAEQNMQHFMSNAPWSGEELIAEVQKGIARRHELQGGILVLDESADEKAGECSAGSGRQHNGRLGKIEQSQVGVYVAYAKDGLWTLWDGTLFLPEKWFSASYGQRRAKAEIPLERVFQTKIELGWELIKRAKAQGLSFVAVAFDSLYGRSHWLREQCEAAHIEYYADIPANYPLYLQQPAIDYPLNKSGKPSKKFKVLGQAALKASDLATLPQTYWKTIDLRPSERGHLQADFASYPVWTLNAEGKVRQETLLMKHEGKQIRYSLTNAPISSSLTQMAQRKAQRYFVESSLQDAKSELGMDEFQAIKYRAWQHHLALTILAAWFIAETKLDWQKQFPLDPQLAADYETDLLPNLSMANVRELLRATLPLRQLSIQEAAALVVKHLDNRSRSRRSRLKTHPEY
jgi:SRSO17 transposase